MNGQTENLTRINLRITQQKLMGNFSKQKAPQKIAGNNLVYEVLFMSIPSPRCTEVETHWHQKNSVPVEM